MSRSLSDDDAPEEPIADFLVRRRRESRRRHIVAWTILGTGVAFLIVLSLIYH
jgi:hypothetical protein